MATLLGFLRPILQCDCFPAKRGRQRQLTDLPCRTKALHERDPVNTLKLSDMVKATLPQASAAHGGNVFNDALNALDPSLAGQLQAVLRC